MIYRRKDGVAIENEDSDTSIALSGAKDYAKEAIRDYPVSQAAKDLAMVMIDNDDQFFEELNRRFEL